MTVNSSYEYVELGEVPTHSDTRLSVRVTKNGDVRLSSRKHGQSPYGWVLSQTHAKDLGEYLTRAAAKADMIGELFLQRQEKGEELDTELENLIMELMEDTE